MFAWLVGWLGCKRCTHKRLLLNYTISQSAAAADADATFANLHCANLISAMLSGAAADATRGIKANGRVRCRPFLAKGKCKCWECCVVHCAGRHV